MNVNWPALFEFLKEPGTIKGIITLLGVLGLYIDPAKLTEIAMALGTIYGLIGMFYDRNKRKPPEIPQQTPPVAQ